MDRKFASNINHFKDVFYNLSLRQYHSLLAKTRIIPLISALLSTTKTVRC